MFTAVKDKAAMQYHSNKPLKCRPAGALLWRSCRCWARKNKRDVDTPERGGVR